jgi:hypothetical protein
MTTETQLLREALREIDTLPAGLLTCDANGNAVDAYIPKWRVVEILASKLSAPAQPASAGVTAAQRDTLIDAELEARGYPSNSRNAARAGWYAHAKAMAAQPASGEAVATVEAMTDERFVQRIYLNQVLPVGTKLYTTTPASQEPYAETWFAVLDMLDEVHGKQWRKRCETLHDSLIATIKASQDQACPATTAGTDVAMGHLSRLVDEAVVLLGQLRQMVDDMHKQWCNGGVPERGEFPLIDRVDDWLAARPSQEQAQQAFADVSDINAAMVIREQAQPSDDDRATIEDYQEALRSVDALVRRLDVALNGDGAAPQARLCDIVSQVEAQPSDEVVAWLMQAIGTSQFEFAKPHQKAIHKNMWTDAFPVFRGTAPQSAQPAARVAMTEAERTEMACAVAQISTGRSLREVAATAIDWTERRYGIGGITSNGEDDRG